MFIVVVVFSSRNNSTNNKNNNLYNILFICLDYLKLFNGNTKRHLFLYTTGTIIHTLRKQQIHIVVYTHILNITILMPCMYLLLLRGKLKKYLRVCLSVCLSVLFSHFYHIFTQTIVKQNCMHALLLWLCVCALTRKENI